MMRNAVFLLLFLTSLMGLADDYDSYYDTSRIEVREFDHTRLEERAEESDFQYDKEEIEQPNVVERFIKWLFEKLFGSVSPTTVNTSYRVFLWLLAIAGAILLFYYIGKLQNTRMLRKDDLSINEVQFMDFEGTEQDLDLAWKEAEAAENFTLAMRLLFIKCLNYLKEKEIIQWKKEKTNGDYLKELENKWEYTPLSRLSRLFAYSQYGGYEIGRKEYEEAKEKYTELVEGKKGGFDEK